MTVHLRGLLLVLLLGAIAMLWLRARRLGTSAALPWGSPWVLFLGVAFIYSLNGRALSAGDTMPASYLPLSLLREFDFDFDEFTFLYEREMPWFLERVNGRVVSAYPPWAGVLALPVYLLPVLGGLSPQSPWIPDLEKLSAVLITALSAVVLLFTLRRLTSDGIAWFVAIVYALGTSSFSSSSQALWQHGPSQLFLCLALYCLVRGVDTRRFSAYAGFALAMSIICRPSNALMALPIAAYVFMRRREEFAGFCLASLPPLAAFLLYNARYHGSPVSTGFAAGIVDASRFWDTGASLFTTPLLEGLAGVLVSPGRGLFVYSPIFLISVVGIVMAWRDPGQVLLKYLSVAALLIVLLAAKWMNWWGGASYGPRLLADITPILSLYLYRPIERARTRLLFQSLIAGLAVVSIGLHALRVFGDGDWNRHPNVNRHPERLWSWTDSPPVYHANSLMMNAVAEVQRRRLSLPTSRDAPDKLAASYHLTDLTPAGPWHPRDFVTCRVRTLNTGEAVWLNRAPGEKGEVTLRWRWLREQQEVPFAGGAAVIAHDVLPGRSYDFTVEVAIPPEPGDYLLELGLVGTEVTSFAERGVAPLLIPIRVGRPDALP